MSEVWRSFGKLLSHGITFDQVQAVPFGRTVITRNRASRAAPYLLIGRDGQGRCLTIPIVPTEVSGGLTPDYCLVLQVE